jgi:hypothetical protein
VFVSIPGSSPRSQRDHAEHERRRHEGEPEHKLHLETGPMKSSCQRVLAAHDHCWAGMEPGSKQPPRLATIEAMKLQEKDANQHKEKRPYDQGQIVSAHRFSQEREREYPEQHPQQGVGHEPLIVLNRTERLPRWPPFSQVEIGVKGASPRFHDRTLLSHVRGTREISLASSANPIVPAQAPSPRGARSHAIHPALPSVRLVNMIAVGCCTLFLFGLRKDTSRGRSGRNGQSF